MEDFLHGLESRLGSAEAALARGDPKAVEHLEAAASLIHVFSDIIRFGCYAKRPELSGPAEKLARGTAKLCDDVPKLVEEGRGREVLELLKSLFESFRMMWDALE
jgi:hypothetical protein